jgi:hypothetical protein
MDCTKDYREDTMKRELAAWILVCILAFLWGTNRVDLYYWKIEALESQRNARAITQTNSKLSSLCFDLADHYWSHLAVESAALLPRRKQKFCLGDNEDCITREPTE